MLHVQNASALGEVQMQVHDTAACSSGHLRSCAAQHLLRLAADAERGSSQHWDLVNTVLRLGLPMCRTNNPSNPENDSREY